MGKFPGKQERFRRSASTHARTAHPVVFVFRGRGQKCASRRALRDRWSDQGRQEIIGPTNHDVL